MNVSPKCAKQSHLVLLVSHLISRFDSDSHPHANARRHDAETRCGSRLSWTPLLATDLFIWPSDSTGLPPQAETKPFAGDDRKLVGAPSPRRRIPKRRRRRKASPGGGGWWYSISLRTPHSGTVAWHCQFRFLRRWPEHPAPGESEAELAMPEAGPPQAESSGHIPLIDPRVCNGKPVIAGTRIPVTVILDHLTAGCNLSDIQRKYPELSTERINPHAARCIHPATAESFADTACDGFGPPV